MARLPSARFTVLGDDLVPDFDLSITGKSASNTASLYDAVRPLVSSVSYEEDEDMASQFEMVVINRPDERGTGRRAKGFADWTQVLDSKVWQEGNYVDLFMGYGGIKQFMGRTEIVKWLPNFGPDGPTEFTVHGQDGRHRMMRGNEFRVKKAGKSRKRKTHYSDVLDDQIVRAIARKYGYGANTDTPKIKRRSSTGTMAARVQPSDLTDWEFLRKLADINRFDLWVDYDLIKKQFVVNFKERRDIGSAGFVFAYNGRDGSLIEAQPDFAIQDQATDVEVLYFDRKRKNIERTIISDTNPAENVRLTSTSVGSLTAQKTISLGARVRFSAFGQVIEAFSDKPFRTKAEAETFVKQWLKERERDFMILRGRVVGVETLRPRQVHQIEGLTTRIDGFYRFTQTKHVMSPGSVYTVEFLAHKVLSQELSRRKATTQVARKATAAQAG